MYLVDSSSPFDPGARPSNSSDARIFMCERIASGVMTSRAGLSFSATLSSAVERETAMNTEARNQRRRVFIIEKSCSDARRGGHRTKRIGAWHKRLYNNF